MATATQPTDARSVQYGAAAIGCDYFIDHYLQIDEPQGETVTVIPFRLWPAQQKLLTRIQQHKQIIILKARQLGISWLVCAYALWLCLFQPGRVVILFSKGQLESDELLRRILVMYQRLPDWMRDASPQLVKQNGSELEWSNQSRVQSLPATKNAGRSFTASLVICDEFAFWQWPDELYTAIKPTIDNGGQLILLSTANGPTGLFYELWQSAVKRANQLIPAFLSWRSRPGRTEEWRRGVEADAINPTMADQEYPATPEDAFSATNTSAFLPDISLWDGCKEDIPPLRPNEPIVVALDAAKGRANQPSDCFAMVAVSRHWQDRNRIAVRAVRTWQAAAGKSIDFNDVERDLFQFFRFARPLIIVYDPTQLHQMAGNLRRIGNYWVEEFQQGADRLRSDKLLYDLIIRRGIAHDGDPVLRQHIQNADQKPDQDKIRIVKRTESLKNDAAVALSMACFAIEDKFNL